MDQHVTDNLQTEVFVSTLFSFALGRRGEEEGKMYSRHEEILELKLGLYRVYEQ